MLISIPYEALKLLGWATLFLVLLSASLHIAILLLSRLLKNKSKSPLNRKFQNIIRRLLPILRNYHPVFAITALLTGIIHGTQLLLEVRLHSGYMAWLLLFIMAVTGVSVKLLKKSAHIKSIRKLHKQLMVILLLLVLFHVLQMKGIF